MPPENTDTPNERAVESGQLSRTGTADSDKVQKVQIETTGYFEPSDLDKLAKYGRLYLIADGLTGGSFGQIAAHYAIKKILHDFYSGAVPDDPKARLLAVIQETNAAIFARNSKYPERRMMSATLSAALVYDNSLTIANVGDNRVYVVWEQDIELLTNSSYKEPPQPEEGELPPLSPDKEEEPPQPLPTLPQAVGMAKEVEIERFSRRLFANDIVVLCSGGLAGYVKEKEIAKAVTRHTPIQAIPRLISLAAGRGNRDRLSISITRILSSPFTARASKSMALVPPLPNWDDWEISPRPDPLPPPPPPITTKPPLIKTPKMRTAKMVNVKPAVSPETAMRIANSLPRIGEKKTGWRWQGLALIILVSICFLCTLPWLAWRYLIPPEMMASIPILSKIEGVVRKESPTIAATTGGATARGGDVQPDGTTIAGNNSPILTPTAKIQPIATTEPTTNPTATIPPVPPTDTPPPAAATETPTPAPSPTPSPTLAPTIVLPEGCVNKGRFVSDVTVPDGEHKSPAEQFEKTWLVTNAGDCPWGAGYTVNFISGDLLSDGKTKAIIEVTNPDENGEITAPMTAPTTPGLYKSSWQLHDLKGEPFGPELYLEIEVVASVGEQPAAPAEAGQELLYDFIANSASAIWSSEQTTYTVLETNDINENMDLPAPQGIVAVGQALLRGDKTSEGNVLLTYPHQELGIIEGVYQIDDLPLQPTDTIAATLGFVKLSILSDDGVTFEFVFIPSDGGEEQVILSRNLQYRDSPVTEIRALSGITAGQTGNFKLRVLGGNSLSQDWAVWLDLRLLR